MKDALKEYFAPKKEYSQYCAEIQAVRMRSGESVLEYYSRIKKLTEGAKATLKEKFNEDQVGHMITMLEGIALESFRRGLADDLSYAVNVKEANNIDKALKISLQIERNMTGTSIHKGSMHLIEAHNESPQPRKSRES